MPKMIELVDPVPVVADQGHIGFSAVQLIEGEDRHGQTRRLVVDSAHSGRRQHLVDALDKLGLTPLDIDYVMTTHAHWDHVQNHDLFLNASQLIHPDERRYAHAPAIDDWATPSWTGYVLEQLPTQEVGDGHEIFPGATIVDLTGHSIGSIGLAVETDQGLAVVAGDALHVSAVAITETNPLVFWDERAATRAIRRVKRMADVIYPAHDAPFRISAGGEIEFLRTIEMAVGGLTPKVVELGAVLPVSLMPGRHGQSAQDVKEKVSTAHIEEVRRLVRGPYTAGAHPAPSSAWDRG
jgi:glyoxylase-like metal-dependent hydrolase (beta-lactamase superfamily II)